MDLKKNFGSRLKELRKLNRWTQEQLAEKVCVDVKHISFLETGRSFPSADLLSRLNSVFKTEFKDLFDFSVKNDRKEFFSILEDYAKNANLKNLKFICKMAQELGK